MPAYKKAVIMILSALLGVFMGYTNAETALTKMFRKDSHLKDAK